MALKQLDGSTEERIKEAARKLFVKQGFAATKTREIAQEAGINLALLNYYFRSKEKLFELIMLENVSHFMMGIAAIVDNDKTLLEEKIEQIVEMYIEMFLQQPDIPLFILTEIRNNPNRLLGLIETTIKIQNTVFIRQITQAIQEGKLMPVHPLHFLANVIGLTVFPFIGQPLLQHIGKMSKEEYEAFIIDRKRLVPLWIMTSFKPQ